MQAHNVYFSYWGKSSRNKETQEQGDEYHLLPWHSLDVAAVAACWWDNNSALRQRFCQNPLLNEKEVRAWVLFFIALHDLGKWDIRFQCKAVNSWLALHPADKQSSLPDYHHARRYDHGSSGLFWFINDFQPAPNDSDFLTFDEPLPHPYHSWISWMEAVTGHHGYIRRETQLSESHNGMPHTLRHFSLRDKKAREGWIQALESLFLAPAELSINDIPPTVSPLLAGFCSVSDWLGSWRNDDTFHYCSALPEGEEGLQKYFTTRYENDARQVIKRSGLLGKANSYAGVQSLLDKGCLPRQLQILVDDLPVAPGLTLIEAPTGSGKTETALACAWKLIEKNLADSIIFALPTQATANAMLKRMQELSLQLFDKPNLILAHGNSLLNSDFQAIKRQAINYQEQDQEAWAQCCEWLSQSRKRVFLGQMGVCTIDQVLVSVLPVKHRFIRGFGVGRSVLIVDEVHAYDNYMNGLLTAVLKEQAVSGGSAILLSATLPSQLRHRLLSTYEISGSEYSPEPLSSEPYPLINWRGTDRAVSLDLQQHPEHLPKAFDVYLEALHIADLFPDQVLMNRIVDAAYAGAQVCIICNLVDDAQKVYQLLQEHQLTDIDVLLFHARFTLNDRQHKESGVLTCFGKNGDRSRGRVLVATQVVEQSLDVDFDWLITQLCPVDLLFQRVGRLHRHQNKRPEMFSLPKVTVLLPEGEGYGTHGLIYNHTRVMWQTQQHIEAQGTQPLSFPEAYRRWIEPVYSEDGGDDEPQWVVKGMEDYENDQFKKRTSVRSMLDWAENTALQDDDHHVRAVTRDGEMSLPVVPFVQTPEGQQLLDKRIVEQLDEYHLREALMLNRVNVPHRWGKLFEEKEDDNGVLWLAGSDVQEEWHYEGKKLSLRYSMETGMVLTIPVKSK